MNEVRIIVKGMNCSHCEMTIENSINAIEGIKDSKANQETGEVIVHGDKIDLDKIRDAVERVGYVFEGTKD